MEWTPVRWLCLAALCILMVPDGRACTLSAEPKHAAEAAIWNPANDERQVFTIHERQLTSLCRLGNPTALSATHFAWVDGANIQLFDRDRRDLQSIRLPVEVLRADGLTLTDQFILVLDGHVAYSTPLAETRWTEHMLPDLGYARLNDGIAWWNNRTTISVYSVLTDQYIVQEKRVPSRFGEGLYELAGAQFAIIGTSGPFGLSFYAEPLLGTTATEVYHDPPDKPYLSGLALAGHKMAISSSFGDDDKVQVVDLRTGDRVEAALPAHILAMDGDGTLVVGDYGGIDPWRPATTNDSPPAAPGGLVAILFAIALRRQRLHRNP